MTPQMQQTIQNALAYFELLELEIDDIHETPDSLSEEEQTWIIFSQIDTTIGVLRIALMVQDQKIIAYTFHPLVVVKPSLTTAMEFVTRANFGLPLGKFELDIDTGDLRFSSGREQEKVFSIAEIANLIDNSLGLICHYHTPLIESLFNQVPPSEAISKSEQSF
ncbi:MAG: hypothetical protein CMK59_13995 [Proteobacteria bacterium]|nr:hypothetical protein [Pseudomonadota bacterium]